MTFWSENRFIIISILIISAIFGVFWGNIYRRTYIESYTAHGVFGAYFNPDEQILQVYCHEAKDSIYLKFDSIGKSLLTDKFYAMQRGEKLWFDVKRQEWKIIRAETRKQNVFTALSLSMVDEDIFTIDAYLEQIVKNNRRQHILLYFKVIVALLLLDLIRRNKEYIIEKLEQVAEIIDSKIDPLYGCSEDLKDYINYLKDADIINESDKIILPKQDKKMPVELSSSDFKIESSSPKSAILVFTAIVAASFFLEIEHVQRIYIIILYAAFLTTLLFSSKKPQNSLLLKPEGLDTGKMSIIKWDDIQYSLIISSQNRNLLLVKLFHTQYPVKVDLGTPKLGLKKTGLLIETFKNRYKKSRSK
jgi:hypothetical protein